jgi:lipopolysaccharide export LptBFGC system permease protein LptF
VDAICPNSGFEKWQVGMIIFAVACVAGALLLALGLGACGLVYFLRKYQQARSTTYAPVIQSPPTPQAGKTLNPEGTTGTKKNGNNLTVYRRNDGKIVISVGDGNVRIVTPEQYQILYERQNRRKRAVWAKLQALKHQSKDSLLEPQEAPAVFKEFASVN